MASSKTFRLGFILSATDKMSRVIDKAIGDSTKKLSAFERNTAKVGKSVMKAGAAMTAAGVAVGTATFGVAKATAAYGDKMWKTSQMVGMGVEEFQKLAYAAKYSGVGIDEFSMGLAKFNKTITDAAAGSQTAGRVFKDLGINLKDAQGNLRAPDEIFKEVAEVFENLEGNAAKSAAAMDLFGRSGVKMIPLLNSGKKGLEAMGDEAVRMGFVLSEETTKAGETFNDNFLRITDHLKGLTYQLGSALIPHLDRLIQKVNGVLDKVISWVQANPELVSSIGKAALKVAGFLVTVGPASAVLGGVATGIGKVVGAIKKFQSVTAAKGILNGITSLMSPLGWIKIAIIGLAVAAYFVIKNWDKISGWFKKLWDDVKVTFQKALDWIKNLWSSVTGWFTGLCDGVKNVFTKAWQGIKNIFLNYTPTGLVIKHWDKITGFFGRLWDSVKSGISKGWEAIKNIFFNYTPYGLLISHWQDLPQIFGALWNKVKDVTVKVWDSIGEFFSGLGQRFFDWGRNLITALWNGIKSVVDNVIEKIKNVGRKIANGFKSVLGINSPSKVFMQYGLNITQGLADGIDKGAPAAEASAGGVASGIFNDASQSYTSSVLNNSYAGGGVNLNYSPNITINGNMSADEKKDFTKMLREHSDEIIRMFEEWQRNKQRLSFI